MSRCRRSKSRSVREIEPAEESASPRQRFAAEPYFFGLKLTLTCRSISFFSRISCTSARTSTLSFTLVISSCESWRRNSFFVWFAELIKSRFEAVQLTCRPGPTHVC